MHLCLRVFHANFVYVWSRLSNCPFMCMCNNRTQPVLDSYTKSRLRSYHTADCPSLLTRAANGLLCLRIAEVCMHGCTYYELAHCQAYVYRSSDCKHQIRVSGASAADDEASCRYNSMLSSRLPFLFFGTLPCVVGSALSAFETPTEVMTEKYNRSLRG